MVGGDLRVWREGTVVLRRERADMCCCTGSREGGEGRGAISPTRSDLSSWTSEWPLGWRWGEDVVCSVRRRGPEGRVCKGMIDGWMD
jgi:hypothetical protein